MNLLVSRWWVFATTLIVVAAAGCGPAASSGSSGSSGSAGSSGLVPWKHGIVAAKADSAYLLMAREKSFFQQQGLDVQYVEFQSDATMAQALIAGELDSMEANPSATLSAVDKGSNLKIIGTTMPGMPYALYSRTDINSLQDLRGKTLGISAPGALPEVMAKAMLLSQGVPPDAVTFSNAGGDAQRFAALSAGKVDAVAAATEFAAEVKDNPNIKVLAMASDLVPQYLRFMVIVNGNTLKAKPHDAVVGFLAAEMQGLRYALDHRDEALALCAKTIESEPTNARCTDTYDQVKAKKYVDPNMDFDVADLAWLQNLRIQLSQQKTVMPADKLMDLSYRDEAVQKIGRLS